jgi:molybdenum cofactor biosynthesis enzyme MoaA
MGGRVFVDKLGRRFRNLRVNLKTARNYVCTYCVPDRKGLQPTCNELAATKLRKAVRLL